MQILSYWILEKAINKTVNVQKWNSSELKSYNSEYVFGKSVKDSFTKYPSLYSTSNQKGTSGSKIKIPPRFDVDDFVDSPQMYEVNDEFESMRKSQESISKETPDNFIKALDKEYDSKVRPKH